MVGKKRKKEDGPGKLARVGRIAWKYGKPNEIMLILIGVFIVLAVITVIKTRKDEDEKFQGKVRYDMRSTVEGRMIESVPEDGRIGENDSGLRYAERIKEASSIGLGLSLYLIRERVSAGRVIPISQVMSEFSKNELLPPGVDIVPSPATADYGTAKTLRGLYLIRYSARPLRLEILATGWNGLSDGAVFIVRVPDASGAAADSGNSYGPKVASAGAWATLFEAPENPEHGIPPAFSPVQSFVAMNWRIRGLTQTEISAEKLVELNNFLNGDKTR